MMMQKVDLYQPMVHARVGAPPLAIRVAVNRSSAETMGGPVEGAYRPETYVLLSALPDELRERVRTAVEMMSTF
jgi:hypothetical protein